MKVKFILLVFIVFLLSVSFVSSQTYDNETQAIMTHLRGTNSETHCGKAQTTYWDTATTTVSVISLKKPTSSTATIGRIVDSSNRAIANATFVGDYATFDFVIQPNTEYRFGLDGGGSSVKVYDNLATSFPVVNDYLNFTTNAYGGSGLGPFCGNSIGGSTSFGIERIELKIVGSTPNNFTITAKDIYDNSSINNFSISVDGETYTTSTGTITTHLLQNDTNTYNIDVFNANNSNGEYFATRFNSVSVSSNYQAILTQAYINLRATELITNNSLNGTFKINGTTKSNLNLIPIKAGTYNFSFINSSYYQKDYLYTIEDLDNKTITINNIYDQLIKVNVSSAASGMTISNFSLNITGIGYFNSSTTTTGIINLGVLKNRSYYLQLARVEGYADNYGLNTTINSSYSVYNQSFNLYTENSIKFNIKKTLDSTFINQLVYINLYGSKIDYSFNTTNGELYVDGLLDDTYRIVFSSGNYTDVTLYATVSNYSYQVVNAFLEADLNEIIFRVKDNSGDYIENVQLSFTRLINGSTVTVFNAETDFSGTAIATLNPDIKYTITATHSSYSTFTGSVIPVLTSYTINLDDLGETQFISTFEDIDYTTNINYPFNSTWALLTFQIVSGNGALEYYGYNFTYNGVNYLVNQSGSTTGGTETTNITNINVTAQSKITVNFFYKTTTGGFISWNEIFTLKDIVAGEYSLTGGLFSSLDNWDDGLKVFIGMVVLLVGMITITVVTRRVLAGSITGMLITGFMAYLGFFPMNLSIISIIILTLLFISDSLSGGLIG